MNRPWNRKNAPLARALDVSDGWSFRHPADPPLPARLPIGNARDAVNKVVTEMAGRGAIDAGNGDVLDPWIDSLRPQWLAHHVMAGADGEAAAQVAAGEYAAAAAAARQRAEAKKAERDHTRRLVSIFEQRLLAPNEQPAMDHPDRRRRPRPSLDALEGLTPQRGWKVISLLLLLLAAAGDLASFYVTLAGTLGGEAVMVWILTIALTAAAVGVMHVVGRTARNLREGQGGLGRASLLVMTAGWLALGTAAFYLRAHQVDTTRSAGSFAGAAAAQSTDPLLSAILLAALFIGSGILAYWIGFSDHHPRMTPYLKLRRDLRVQEDEVAELERKAIEAEELRDNARAEVRRTAARTAAAEASVDAEIAELKELARIHVAGLLGEPAATNNLITGRGAPTPPAATPPSIPRPARSMELPTQSGNGNGHPAAGSY